MSYTVVLQSAVLLTLIQLGVLKSYQKILQVILFLQPPLQTLLILSSLNIQDQGEICEVIATVSWLLSLSYIIFLMSTSFFSVHIHTCNILKNIHTRYMNVLAFVAQNFIFMTLILPFLTSRVRGLRSEFYFYIHCIRFLAFCLINFKLAGLLAALCSSIRDNDTLYCLLYN